MDKPVFFLLTGRRRAGKDTFADILKAEYPDSILSLAIADWFKKALAEAFSMDPKSFYDDRKDAAWAEPVAVSPEHITVLGRIMAGFTGRPEAFYVQAMGKHLGTMIDSNRRLMEWLGFDFIKNELGDVVNCEITKRRIEDAVCIWKHEHPNQVLKAIVVTDARLFEQSKWFSDNFENVVRIRITRLTGGTYATTGVEAATEQFPDGWFNYELVNPYPARDEYVKSVLKIAAVELQTCLPQPLELT
jgi:hypothetical protein